MRVCDKIPRLLQDGEGRPVLGLQSWVGGAFLRFDSLREGRRPGRTQSFTKQQPKVRDRVGGVLGGSWVPHTLACHGLPGPEPVSCTLVTSLERACLFPQTLCPAISPGPDSIPQGFGHGAGTGVLGTRWKAIVPIGALPHAGRNTEPGPLLGGRGRAAGERHLAPEPWERTEPGSSLDARRPAAAVSLRAPSSPSVLLLCSQVPRPGGTCALNRL